MSDNENPRATGEAVATGNDGLEWPQTMDGVAWGIEFNKKFPSVPVNDACRWFCSAIMRGWDRHEQKNPAPRGRVVTEADAEVLSAVTDLYAWYTDSTIRGQREALLQRVYRAAEKRRAALALVDAQPSGDSGQLPTPARAEGAGEVTVEGVLKHFGWQSCHNGSACEHDECQIPLQMAARIAALGAALTAARAQEGK
jgi:hypothetical protein